MDSAPRNAFTYLSSESLHLSRDSHGALQARVDGRNYEDVKPVRAFPLTAPSSCVFLLDGEEHEIGLIAELNELEPKARELIEAELAQRYFPTQIESLFTVKSSHGVTTWEAQTDRGMRTVHIKDRSDIRRLERGHVVFTDVEGIRYEIPDTSKLDDRSQALLDAET